ncbi:MAG: hypothetical protein IPM54_44150 [Polyangiaceae bacterium]|nr:hypothetical protein [Polyangiaceae bacterium]
MKRCASLGLLFLLSCAGCTETPPPLPGLSTFHVRVTAVNGMAPPSADSPLPANKGDIEETWDFEIEARSPYGEPVSMDGVVRLTVEPGVVINVTGDGATGRNIPLVGGKAKGTATLTAMYGNARLWVEDIGYVPVALAKIPACADGKDDDGDELIDFPADPGCAFADDDNEEVGTFAAGISNPIYYSLPRLSDIQGNGSSTPYPYEAVQVETRGALPVVVTRVSSDGFYVTDLTGQATGYNHMFAFNFSTPAGMRVCDKVTYLSGTVVEFFGFTEISFPSFKLERLEKPEDCMLMPTPTLLDGALINDAKEMEKHESSLVRIEGFRIGRHFGPKTVVNLKPDEDHSNCDLNGDGQVDFENPMEGQCSDNCASDVECTEWTSYSARGNYKVYNGSTQIQIQTGTAAEFDPVGHKGEVLTAVTGTLRNFSGGSLNWTIEARCPDDLLCQTQGCAEEDLPPTQACIRIRTNDDPDQSTN